MLANNRITKVDPMFAEMCPKLEVLILTNNKISSFQEIDNIARACAASLIRLSLLGNLVTNLPHYRAFTIYRLPKLRVLDFQKVTKKERLEAKKLFEDKEG